MSRDSSYDIPTSIHAALVESVKQVSRSHEFGKDIWFRFCHAHAPFNAQHRSVSWDPQNYSVGFLGDFLQHVSQFCLDEAAVSEFSTRKCRKVDRGPGFSRPAAVKEVDKLWIVVGESVLFGAPPSLREQCREVSLRSDYVHHSGTAVAMLLGCLSSGIVQERLRIRLSESFSMGCIHFEGAWCQFPRSSDQAAYHGRLDNLNNVLRAFGVDAKATRRSLGYGVRSNLHPRLRHFVGVGGGSHAEHPCFHISPDTFLDFMVSCRTKVLHDRLLVQMLHRARAGEVNGIETWYAKRNSCVLRDVLHHYDEPGASSLCLVLSPSGVALQPPTSCERREPDDIFCLRA